MSSQECTEQAGHLPAAVRRLHRPAGAADQVAEGHRVGDAAAHRAEALPGGEEGSVTSFLFYLNKLRRALIFFISTDF